MPFVVAVFIPLRWFPAGRIGGLQARQSSLISPVRGGAQRAPGRLARAKKKISPFMWVMEKQPHHVGCPKKGTCNVYRSERCSTVVNGARLFALEGRLFERRYAFAVRHSASISFAAMVLPAVAKSVHIATLLGSSRAQDDFPHPKAECLANRSAALRIR